MFSADLPVQNIAATISYVEASQLNEMTIQHKVLFIIVKMFEKWRLPWSKENFRHIQTSAGFLKIVAWAMDNSPSEIAGTGEDWTRIDQDLLSPPTGRTDEFIVERLRKVYEQFDNFDELFAQALADLKDTDDEADLPGKESPDGEPTDCDPSLPECDHTAETESTKEGQKLARAQEVDRKEKEGSAMEGEEERDEEETRREKQRKEERRVGEDMGREKAREKKNGDKKVKDEKVRMEKKGTAEAKRSDEEERKKRDKEQKDAARAERSKRREGRKKEEEEKEEQERGEARLEGQEVDGDGAEGPPTDEEDKTERDSAYSQEEEREDTSGTAATSASPAATFMSSAPSPATNATSITSLSPLEGSLKIVPPAPSDPRRALSTMQTQVNQSSSRNPQRQPPKTAQKGKKRAGDHQSDKEQVRKHPRT